MNNEEQNANAVDPRTRHRLEQTIHRRIFAQRNEQVLRSSYGTAAITRGDATDVREDMSAEWEVKVGDTGAEKAGLLAYMPVPRRFI